MPPAGWLNVYINTSDHLFQVPPGCSPEAPLLAGTQRSPSRVQGLGYNRIHETLTVNEHLLNMNIF